MTRPAPLPEDLPPGPFDVREAKALGVSPARLRRADLRRPFHGIRSPQSSQTFDAAVPGETVPAAWLRARARTYARAREFSVRMPSDQFFSHATAALLHDLPLPSRFLERRSLDVATAVRGQRRRGAGVHGHLVPNVGMGVMNVRGLRVASVVDVWCQLATSLTRDELIILGDSLVRRQNPPATMDQLKRAVASHSGRPGVRLLREALALVRERTDSARETRLRLIIVRAGLPEPEVNPEIVNRYGAFLAWGDLVYRRYRVLVEYDGEQHREDERQFHRDVDRLDALMEERWRVIRFNKSHLAARHQEIIGKIRRALIERGWTPAE
jgi:hypothetical protein